MRLGGTWIGADGTEYTVIKPQDVEATQPRWWIDVPPHHGDVMCGPATPARLHLVPLRLCGKQADFALVLLS